MDFTPVIAQVWSMLVWFIPAVFLIALLKSPWAKGQIGELLVRFFARQQLDEHTYRRLHNVTLNTPDGTTQTDHVFLSPFGIFVLETKNMSGWIFGTEKQAQWTQKRYKRTVKFQNPLWQNYKYLKALDTTLGVNPEHLNSVITYLGVSTFKTGVRVNMTQGIRLIRHIKSCQQAAFGATSSPQPCCPLQTNSRAPTAASHHIHVRSTKSSSTPIVTVQNTATY